MVYIHKRINARHVGPNVYCDGTEPVAGPFPSNIDAIAEMNRRGWKFGDYTVEKSADPTGKIFSRVGPAPGY